MGIEVQKTLTPLELHLAGDYLLGALRRHGIEPNRQEAFLLLAQVWVETARGSSLFNRNPGNLSANPDTYPGDYFRPPWFVVDEQSSLQMQKLHDLMLENKAPRAFRSYDSFDVGFDDYVDTLSKKFPSILKAAAGGDPNAMASAIRSSGYTPDAPPSTGDTLRALSLEFAQKGLFQTLPLVSPGQGSGSSSSLPSPPSGLLSPNGPARADLPLLELGSHGSAVKLWQRIVGVEETGFFAAITDAATRVFQHRKGIREDGKVGPITWSTAP